MIEDDQHLISILDFLLKDEGYKVRTASSGEIGIEIIKKEHIDLILLDINLPGIDGLEVCNRIKTSQHIPIIILSCRDKDSDVISGLELGAEDYMRKPFNHRELVLRIKTLLGRSNRSKPKYIKTGELAIKVDREMVLFGSKEIKLTPIEYKIIEVLGSKIDWIMSWQVLLKEVWGYDEDWDGGRELVKVNIRRLRKKIEPDSSQPKYLITERGRGYKLALI